VDNASSFEPDQFFRTLGRKYKGSETIENRLYRVMSWRTGRFISVVCKVQACLYGPVHSAYMNCRRNTRRASALVSALIPAEHSECVLELGIGRENPAWYIFHLQSSNQTCVFSQQSLNPVWLERFPKVSRWSKRSKVDYTHTH